MNNNSVIQLRQFLIGNGFKAGESKYSPEHFGNFFEIWQSAAFNVQIINNRLILSFAVSGKLEKNNWFEIELINGLIFDSLDFRTHFEPDAAVLFIMSHLDQIKELFSKQNYRATKTKLEEFRQIRMKQLLPNLRIKK